MPAKRCGWLLLHRIHRASSCKVTDHVCYSTAPHAAAFTNLVTYVAQQGARTTDQCSSLHVNTSSGCWAAQPHQHRQRHGAAKQESESVLEYTGPLSTTIKRLKMLSLFSTACSLVGAPVIVFLDAGLDATIAAKLGIAASLSSFGFFTTGLLHWFTSAYVHRLVYRRDKETGTAETLNILARPVRTTFRLADVRYADSVKPLTSFQVGNKLFYIDKDHFPDKDLGEQLSPPDPLSQPPQPGPDSAAKQRAGTDRQGGGQ